MLRTARKFPRRQYDSPHGQAVLGDEVQLKHFSRTPKLHVFFCPDPLSSVAADDDEVGNRWTELTDADRTQLSMSRRERHRERERETMFRETVPGFRSSIKASSTLESAVPSEGCQDAVDRQSEAWNSLQCNPNAQKEELIPRVELPTRRFWQT